ncbi:DNA phosphorothioation-dependent restriction protein DptF, partial [Escherichia coli]|nr:DNA phosphorothioation-dependent restriction protein DptF [Escherichia coli]
REIKVPEYIQPRVSNNLDDKIDKLLDQKLAQLSDLIQTNLVESTIKKEQISKPIEISASHLALTQNIPKYNFLYDTLRKLSNSAKEAIENINVFNEMKQYLHVERHIQADLEILLNKKANEDSPSLILLAGSVGDGKSHLLSYLKQNKPELMKHFTIHNDATESFSPSLSALDTLKLVLTHFSDQHLDQGDNKKLILAINLGVLHSFLYSEFEDITFTKLRDIVDQHNIFEENSIEQVDDNFVSVINFSNYQLFELGADHVSSSFYSQLLKKVFSREDDNLFYKAYLKDKNNQLANTLLHENFIFMCNDNVQKHVVRMLIEIMLQHKISISARAFLNFLADIVIPQDIQILERQHHQISVSELTKHGTPNLLFSLLERSNILDLFISKDPLANRGLDIDSYLVQFNTSNAWREICANLKISDLSLSWIETILSHYERNFNEKDEDFVSLYSFIIRYHFLSNSVFFNKFQDAVFDEYIRILYGYNINDQKTLKAMYTSFEESIYSWRNSPKPDFYLDAQRASIRLAQKLRLSKVPSGANTRNNNSSDLLTRFVTQLRFVYKDKKDKLFHIDCDYNLYSYLYRVRLGYVSKTTDYKAFVSFVQFIDKLVQNGHKDSEITIHFTQLDRKYELVKESFGDEETYIFRKGHV